MLQLTKRTEYGLIALVHMVDRGGEPISVRELCERNPVPKRVMAEVLKDLGRSDLVESHRGATGGYSLARAPESITLGEIVAALEGAPALTNCDVPTSLRSASCDVKPNCPIRSPLQRVHERLIDLLEHTTLRSLSDPARERAQHAGGLSPTTV